MKILLIHNYYKVRGGEYTIVNQQKKILEDNGHQVIFYSKDNQEIDSYNIFKMFLFFMNAIFSLSTYKEISKIVQEKRPDVAHVHNVFPLISPSIYFVLSKKKIPIVQTIHNFRFLCPNGLFYTKNQVCERCKMGNTIHAIKYKCYRDSYLSSCLYAIIIGLHRKIGTFKKISKYIVLTEFSAKKLIESHLTHAKRISVLGNPINLDEIQQLMPIYKRFHFVYLGRLSKEKGIDLLIKAFSDFQDHKLKIIGDGPLLHELLLLVNKMNLNNVEFLGYIEGHTKNKILSEALAVIIPSLVYETFGLVAIESMALGTAVIASDIGSLPYIIEDGKNGLLFQTGDLKNLQEKIRYILQNPDKRKKMEVVAKKFAKENFDNNNYYQQLISIYKDVL